MRDGRTENSAKRVRLALAMGAGTGAPQSLEFEVRLCIITPCEGQLIADDDGLA